MKNATKGAGLIVRLGMTAVAVLFTQQVLAAGTDAGTPVQNQATVAYDVNGNNQTPIESSPGGNSVPGSGAPTQFLVDRRVDFTMTTPDAPNPVGPVQLGDTNVVATFTLTNNGNAIMDFRLNLDGDYTTNPVFGNADTADMTNYRIRVANGDGAGGVPDLATDHDYVDELAEDETVVIYVFADAPLAASGTQHANIQLTAYAADDANAAATVDSLDADLVADTDGDDPALIESVFADAGNDGLEQVEDSYEIVAASLTISKTSAVISDPVSPGPDYYALPDAVVEYTVIIDNSGGTSDAQNVVVTDNIQFADVTFEDGAYGAATQDVSIDDGVNPLTYCDADPGDAACTYNSGTGALSIAVPDIAAGATTTIKYQVRINP